MKKFYYLFFILFSFAMPAALHAACSSLNLQTCLDSACNLNSMDHGERCNLCGGGSGNSSRESTGLQSLSLGASKYALTDKELKNAPTGNAGQRYIWATDQCLKKVVDCTPDNVDGLYDKLIETSCKAIGIDNAFASAKTKIESEKTEDACRGLVQACMTRDSKCLADWSGCFETADFDRIISACLIEEDCGRHGAALRTGMTALVRASETRYDNIAPAITQKYAAARESKLREAQDQCKPTGKDACISNMCGHFANKCSADAPNEKIMANLLCKYFDTACAKLK
ncbi:MAG: hypothetical protein LBO08_00505 [Rickettsiales bacterium]|jgi:hypothetical protein|nr:hypothetical protein [Rickettsiales bacterium]